MKGDKTTGIIMLTGNSILKNTKQTFIQKIMGRKPNIIIQPFDIKCLGPNSYDIHLADTLLVYTNKVLDSHAPNPTKEIKISKKGYILQPGELYLGSTIEYTETYNLVPKIDGRSSIGRLGVQIHSTAGFGDVGFCGNWTLEITVPRPVKIYPGIRIGQLYYETVRGKITNYNGHYQGQKVATASQMHNKDNWQR